MPVFPSLGVGGDTGDQITEDYQYQIRDTLFGAGTPLIVEKVTGLLGHAATRSKDIEREHSHGSIPGMLLYSPRTIQFDLKPSSQYNDTAVEDLLDQLSDAFQAPKLRVVDELELDAFAYKRPGREMRQFFGRGTRFDVDSDWRVARGLAAASCEFVCNDPMSYSVELHTQTVALAIGETSDSMVVENLGNGRNGSPPVIYISGTATNPIVENADDEGRELKLEVILASNQIARINMETFEVGIQTGGGSNPFVINYEIVPGDSQWFRLMPGENTLTMQRTGSTAGSSLRVDWYDCWARG